MLRIILIAAIFTVATTQTASATTKADPLLRAELVSFYAGKDKNLKPESVSVDKINNIVASYHTAHFDIKSEEHKEMRKHYVMAARLMDSGYVVSASALMNAISTLPEFESSPTGVTLKGLVDGSFEYSNEWVKESGDKALIEAYELINKYLSPYKQVTKADPVMYRYIEQGLLGAAYGDKVAVDSAVALILSAGSANFSTKLKKEAITLGKEMVALRGRYK